MKTNRLIMVTIVLVFTSGFVSTPEPDRKWEIYLIHHTHVDIGYTEPQEDVMRKQWNNLEKAMEMVDATAEMPDDARFRWNPETTWPIETWLEQADEDERQKFIRQVQGGYIGLDGLYGNLLTSLCRPEELMQSLSYKKELEKLTGTTIDSAMITDVPGWTWGLVTALSKNGIRYLSLGVNRNHRIGFIRKDWGDKPFYWVSPSGDEKVLVFIHGQGYSWFHDLLNPGSGNVTFTERKIMPYLKKLEKEGYPYDIVPIRYAIGADNGPPDPNISRVVKEWNEEHPNVRVRLTTASEALSEFETRYGDQVPEFRGDFTPYWEDGAASTARETAIVRGAAEKLTQSRIAQAMFDGDGPLTKKYDEAWKEVMLFNEHTWGAHNSISDPDSEFAKTQWEWKRQRAIDADKLADELMAEALEAVSNQKADNTPRTVSVINTHSWDVTGPVKIEKGNFVGTRVETESGEKVPSQITSDGKLMFLAGPVPAMSSKKYLIKEEDANGGKEICRVTENSISNGLFELTLDTDSGTISSIKESAGGREYVNRDFRDGFNEYVYIKGRIPELGRRKTRNPEVLVTIKEKGPLVCSIVLEREVFNSESLTTTITMYGGLDRIDLNNTLDRPVVRSKEGIHFAFPVNVVDPRLRYDVAWGSVEADEDQISGANKNYMTALRWADISGNEAGMQFVLVDAPMFEAGEINMDAFPLSTANFVYKWSRKTKQNGVIYSYVMNNYWETNYKADQPGVTTFRYSLFPHDGYDVSENNRKSLEVMQPLMAVTSSKDYKTPKEMPRTDNEKVIIQSVGSIDSGDGLRLSLYNTADDEEGTTITGCGKAYLMESGDDTVPLDNSGLQFAKHELKEIICR